MSARSAVSVAPFVASPDLGGEGEFRATSYCLQSHRLTKAAVDGTTTVVRGMVVEYLPPLPVVHRDFSSFVVVTGAAVPSPTSPLCLA